MFGPFWGPTDCQLTLGAQVLYTLLGQLQQYPRACQGSWVAPFIIFVLLLALKLAHSLLGLAR